MSLGTTGALHDKSTLRIAKMNLEQCPDTRHTVAFPTDTFDIKFKTLPILLAEMRHHARLHLSGAGELLRRAGDQRTRRRHRARRSPLAAELVRCNQCRKMVKDSLLHLFEQQLDAMHRGTQARRIAKHGPVDAKPTHKHTRVAGKLLSLTNSGMHATAQTYRAAGATWPSGTVRKSPSAPNIPRRTMKFPSNISLCLCLCLRLARAPLCSRCRLTQMMHTKLPHRSPCLRSSTVTHLSHALRHPATCSDSSGFPV